MDVLLELAGEFFQSAAAVAGCQADDEAVRPALFKAFFQHPEGGACFKKTMHKHDVFAASHRGSFRRLACGATEGKDAGEKCEEFAVHAGGELARRAFHLASA